MDAPASSGESAQPTQPAAPSPAAQPSRGSILIVEDDRLLRELLMEKLTRAGFSPREAIDGQQALAAIEAQTPDLVLLDLVLPGMDGFQILREIRSRKSPIADIPVFVLSNLGDRSDFQRAKDLGANEYFIKAHFSLDEIVDSVKWRLQQS